MRKLLFLFIAILVSWTCASAGRMNTWNLINFKGVWEIKPSNPDYNLHWLIDGLVTDLGNAPITRAELALDHNGWGYLSYESSESAGIINICGTIFTPNPNRECDEVLSFLCRQDAETPVTGIRSVQVANPNNGAARPDDLCILSMDHNHYATFVQLSDDYSLASASEINCCSMRIQYHGNGISVIDANDTDVTVFNIEGILLYQTQKYKGEIISLDKGYSYIVKTNDKAMKISF